MYYRIIFSLNLIHNVKLSRDLSEFSRSSVKTEQYNCRRCHMFFINNFFQCCRRQSGVTINSLNSRTVWVSLGKNTLLCLRTFGIFPSSNLNRVEKEIFKEFKRSHHSNRNLCKKIEWTYFSTWTLINSWLSPISNHTNSQ